uniref:Water stress and hypersensitive response domain-containing protein n=1 Tax=Araucaria cunninghamii TaxID=56994 RepID=A0A0D6R2Z7_ARACU
MSVGKLALGLAVGGAGALLFRIRPREPVFEVICINLKGLKLRVSTESLLPLAVIDLEVIISIKVTNPNVAPIEYKSTVMDIYYRGSLLGQAQVPAGSQGANSSEILEVPAKMDGLEATQHLKDLAKDVAKREMTIRAVVTIEGSAWMWKWGHRFAVRVDSEIKVDPILLDVIEQENKVHLEL